MIRFHGISRLDGGDLDGIHLLWSPPSPTGHSLDGFTIFRRDARGENPRHCFEVSVGQLSEARSQGFVTIEDALVWAGSRDRENATAMWTYRAELVRRHSEVEVTAPDARAAFVGTADGTVIAGAAFTGTSVTLRGSGIAIVWIVTDNPKHPLRICGDTPSEREWSNEKPIVSNLQVPFSSVNGAVGSPADGRALAAARADPEPLDGDFDDVTRHANAALERPGGVPAMRVMSERPGDGGDAWDVSPYGLAAAPALMAPWRRGWGFSHLDRDGLTPGAAYDYRIVGTVPRRDRDELAYDLHTVPRGYRLRRCFRWGTVTVWSDRAVRVEAIDTAPGDPATFRKGFETGRLVVALDEPSSRIVVEAAPGPTIQADGFRYGTLVASTSAPASERTDLDLGVEVDTVVLEGRFAIAGITPHPLDPGLGPDEPVEISQTIYGIEWVPTPGPEIPGSIAVVNLSDPARTAARGTHDANRGFAIDWDAPPATDPAALPFLPGSAAAAPTEVVYYVLERSWAGRPFAPAAGEGMQVSGRNASTGTDSPGWGVDLLRLFPPADAVPSSHSTTVSAVEVFEPDELDYGDEVTYRVASVDATGRVSGHRTSAATPLRKHVRPPAPTTPPATTPVDPDDVPRSGVQVVLLQHDDPDLTATQSALAGSGDVVVVRWGWGPEQRDLDPDVTEFRVYRHGSPLTALDMQPAGPASPSATGWSVPMTVSRPVAAAELADVSVVLGAAFRIEGHGAGTSITLTLAPNAVDPTLAPTPGPLTVNRTTSAELDPEYWDERVLVVPRTPASGDTVEGYEQVIPAGWIATSASMPRQRVAYGVTAADAEPYVTDRRAAIEPAPRPGNESTVAAAEVSARYFGRPQLAIADLADVPAVVLDRQAGDDVHGTFRPADYAPRARRCRLACSSSGSPPPPFSDVSTPLPHRSPWSRRTAPRRRGPSPPATRPRSGTVSTPAWSRTASPRTPRPASTGSTTTPSASASSTPPPPSRTRFPTGPRAGCTGCAPSTPRPDRPPRPRCSASCSTCRPPRGRVRRDSSASRSAPAARPSHSTSPVSSAIPTSSSPPTRRSRQRRPPSRRSATATTSRRSTDSSSETPRVEPCPRSCRRPVPGPPPSRRHRFLPVGRCSTRGRCRSAPTACRRASSVPCTPTPRRHDPC